MAVVHTWIVSLWWNFGEKCHCTFVCVLIRTVLANLITGVFKWSNIHDWKGSMSSSEYQNVPSTFCLVSRFMVAVSLSVSTAQTT